jgi:hypothetical protein
LLCGLLYGLLSISHCIPSAGCSLAALLAERVHLGSGTLVLQVVMHDVAVGDVVGEAALDDHPAAS